ncbi:hypothetical protein CDAR_119451 [Caerostris darwini]|uniref:Uncharacterized protein n=1 Tax=Caerostris darwini TaxID=1538125 RepID=A0AAV4QM36_9ARAC|nr:hypothetical protein CDAR_119451 [Caerostris darwini]
MNRCSLLLSRRRKRTGNGFLQPIGDLPHSYKTSPRRRWPTNLDPRTRLCRSPSQRCDPLAKGFCRSRIFFIWRNRFATCLNNPPRTWEFDSGLRAVDWGL